MCTLAGGTLSSHTAHVLSCARGVMKLIAEIGESLK